MLQLRGQKVVLDTMERHHCKELWNAEEGIEPLPPQRVMLGLSVEGADKWFQDIQEKQNKQQIYLGVFTLEGKIIGDVQLSNINWIDRAAELGLGFARREHRGKGYGTDAAITILRYGFHELDLFRVSASAIEYNTAAIRCLEKIGFVLEGRQRKAFYAGGKRWDWLMYGILRSEFDARHAG